MPDTSDNDLLFIAKHEILHAIVRPITLCIYRDFLMDCLLGGEIAMASQDQREIVVAIHYVISLGNKDCYYISDFKGACCVGTILYLIQPYCPRPTQTGIPDLVTCLTRYP